MKPRIAIGTRGSKLAVIQAESVLAELKRATPGLEAAIVKIATRGDLEGDTALDRFAEQGVFVKELEKALIDGKIDLAVHSLKDLPTEIPDELSLASAMARLDLSQNLIFADNHRIKPRSYTEKMFDCRFILVEVEIR